MFTLRQRLTQILASSISAALIVTSCQIVQAAPSATPDAFERFAPARGLGYLTDTYHGSSDRTIVLIQDLHLHYPTQQRIVKILDHLYSKGLVTGLLAMEGVDGPYDTTKIASYPEGKIKSELVDYFMKKGELSAPEAFSVLRGDGHLLYGVDKGQYYDLNRNLFKASREDRKALQTQLTRIQSGLALLKRQHYSYALRRLDKEEAYGMASAERLLNDKIALCPDEMTRNLVTADHMLRLTQRLIRQEVTLEEARYIAQRLPAFVSLTDQLLHSSSPAVTSFPSSPTAAGGGPIAIGPRQGHSGAMAASLEETLKASIDFYLVALMRNAPMAENTLALMDQQAASSQQQAVPGSPLAARRSPNVVVLVAGGFHTKGLTAAFKKAGVSYVVITPAVPEAPDAAYHELYEKRLAGEHLSQEEMAKDFGQPLSKAMPAVQQEGASIDEDTLAIQDPQLTNGADGKFARGWGFLSQKPWFLRLVAPRSGKPRRTTQRGSFSFGGQPPRPSPAGNIPEAKTTKAEQESFDTVIAQWPDLKVRLEQGVAGYVQGKVDQGVFTPEKANALLKKTVAQVEGWVTSPDIDRYTRTGIVNAIQGNRWEDLVTAYSDQLKFGTAGPRSKAALTAQELVAFKEGGFSSEILKGPNTVSNVTIARLTTGVARHFNRVQTAKESHRRAKVSITWDSRVHGRGLADLVTAIFLREGLDVSLFDVSSPMPEMSFSVAEFKLDLGILISASHNPEAFNGYKVSDPAGAQLAPALRKAIEASIYGDPAHGIPPVTLADIAWIVKASANLEDPTAVTDLPAMTMGPLTRMAWQERGRQGLTFLSDFDRAATADEPAVIDVHRRHRDHVMSLLLMPVEAVREQLSKMFGLYSAMYGNGEGAYNRLIADPKDGLGLPSYSVKEFARLDGLFPKFAQHKPKALIPDPGNSAGQAHAWSVVMEELQKELGSEARMQEILQEIGRRNGVVFGTDPDADRLGVAVPISADQLVNDPSVQQKQLVFYVVPPEWREKVGFAALRLLPANDTWALLTKYRIDRLAEILTPEQKENLHFSIIKTHVTTDQIKALKAYAESKGFKHVEIIEPFVGFSLVADAIRDGWRRGVINISGQEESGGFSIGGAPPIVYTLLHLLQANNNLHVRIDGERVLQEGVPVSDPLLSTDKESYFGYSIKEIQDALDYLKDEGVVSREADGSYRLIAPYTALDHDAFWQKADALTDDAPGERLGKRGHTMEKDGLMALVMMAEVAAYAASQGLPLNQYLWQELYAVVGYYSTTNQALEFPFTQAGTAQKISYLQSVLANARRVSQGEDLLINGRKVERVEIFIPKDPKYADPENFPVDNYRNLIPLLNDPSLRSNPDALKSFFPEEGVRFYFTDGSHLTVRPSGTEPKLRFYVQWLGSDIPGEMSPAERYRRADETAYDVAIAGQKVLDPAFRQTTIGLEESGGLEIQSAPANVAPAVAPAAPVKRNLEGPVAATIRMGGSNIGIELVDHKGSTGNPAHQITLQWGDVARELGLNEDEIANKTVETVSYLGSRIARLLADNDIPADSVTGIGISFAGPLEGPEATLANATNMRVHFSNYDLGAELRKHTPGLENKPVRILNDAEAGALGEGGIYIIWGTGIGGATERNGALDKRHREQGHTLLRNNETGGYVYWPLEELGQKGYYTDGKYSLPAGYTYLEHRLAGPCAVIRFLSEVAGPKDLLGKVSEETGIDSSVIYRLANYPIEHPINLWGEMADKAAVKAVSSLILRSSTMDSDLGRAAREFEISMYEEWLQALSALRKAVPDLPITLGSSMAELRRHEREFTDRLAKVGAKVSVKTASRENEAFAPAASLPVVGDTGSEGTPVVSAAGPSLTATEIVRDMTTQMGAGLLLGETPRIIEIFSFVLGRVRDHLKDGNPDQLNRAETALMGISSPENPKLMGLVKSWLGSLGVLIEKSKTTQAVPESTGPRSLNVLIIGEPSKDAHALGQKLAAGITRAFEVGEVSFKVIGSEEKEPLDLRTALEAAKESGKPYDLIIVGEKVSHELNGVKSDLTSISRVVRDFERSQSGGSNRIPIYLYSRHEDSFSHNIARSNFLDGVLRREGDLDAAVVKKMGDTLGLPAVHATPERTEPAGTIKGEGAVLKYIEKTFEEGYSAVRVVVGDLDITVCAGRETELHFDTSQSIILGRQQGIERILQELAGMMVPHILPNALDLRSNLDSGTGADQKGKKIWIKDDPAIAGKVHEIAHELGWKAIRRIFSRNQVLNGESLIVLDVTTGGIKILESNELPKDFKNYTVLGQAIANPRPAEAAPGVSWSAWVTPLLRAVWAALSSLWPHRSEVTTLGNLTPKLSAPAPAPQKNNDIQALVQAVTAKDRETATEITARLIETRPLPAGIEKNITPGQAKEGDLLIAIVPSVQHPGSHLIYVGPYHDDGIDFGDRSPMILSDHDQIYRVTIPPAAETPVAAPAAPGKSGGPSGSGTTINSGLGNIADPDEALNPMRHMFGGRDSLARRMAGRFGLNMLNPNGNVGESAPSARPTGNSAALAGLISAFQADNYVDAREFARRITEQELIDGKARRVDNKSDLKLGDNVVVISNGRLDIIGRYDVRGYHTDRTPIAYLTLGAQSKNFYVSPLSQIWVLPAPASASEATAGRPAAPIHNSKLSDLKAVIAEGDPIAATHVAQGMPVSELRAMGFETTSRGLLAEGDIVILASADGTRVWSAGAYRVREKSLFVGRYLVAAEGNFSDATIYRWNPEAAPAAPGQIVDPRIGQLNEIAAQLRRIVADSGGNSGRYDALSWLSDSASKIDKFLAQAVIGAVSASDMYEVDVASERIQNVATRQNPEGLIQHGRMELFGLVDEFQEILRNLHSNPLPVPAAPKPHNGLELSGKSTIATSVLIAVGIAAVLGGQTSHAATFGSSMEEAMSGPASGGFNMARTIAANTLLAVSMVIAWFTLFRSQRELAWAYARNLQERLESMKNTAGKSILQKLQEAKTNVRYNGGQLLNTMMAKLPGKGGVEGDRNAAERGISESYTESGA